MSASDNSREKDEPNVDDGSEDRDESDMDEELATTSRMPLLRTMEALDGRRARRCDCWGQYKGT